jgi:SAM-dependent methyltransferase
MTCDTAVAEDLALQELRAHPMVASARRTAGEDSVIEVVPRPETAAGTQEWRFLLEDGWADSFTGRPLPPGEVREWVAASADRIRQLRSGQPGSGQPGSGRLLEIGAGTGLLMRALLADGNLTEYIATDFAESSVRILRSTADEMAAEMASATRVSTVTATADRAPAQVDGLVDTVVLNSVVQYFPSVRYLESVIGQVLRIVQPGGHIFLGDLRDATMLGEFYRHWQHGRGTPGRKGGTSSDFSLEQNERCDFELSLVPEYIRSLAARFPAITAVEVAPRRGQHASERALFRFDAVLHVGCPPLRLRTSYRREYADNARVTATAAAVDPEAIWAQDGADGWRVRVGLQPGRGTDRLEVWRSPGGGPDEHFALSWPHVADPAACGQPPLSPAAGWALRDELAGYLASCSVGCSAGWPGDTRITLTCAHASETERPS